MLRSRGRERSLVALCARSGKCLAKEVQCAGRGCRVAGSVLRFFLGWTQCCQCLVAMTSAAVSAVVVLCRGVCSAHTSANRCSTAQPLGVVGYSSSGGCHCASPCRMDTCSQRAPNLGARPSRLPQLRQLAVSYLPTDSPAVADPVRLWVRLLCVLSAFSCRRRRRRSSHRHTQESRREGPQFATMFHAAGILISRTADVHDCQHFRPQAARADRAGRACPLTAYKSSS